MKSGITNRWCGNSGILHPNFDAVSSVREGCAWRNRRRRPGIPGPRSLTTVGALALIFLALGSLHVRAQTPTNTVMVTRVQTRGQHIALKEDIVVTVTNLVDWAKGRQSDAAKLVPFLDGRQLTGLYPEEVHIADNEIVYRLQILPTNHEVWDSFLRPASLEQEVAFSIGLEDQSPFETVYGGKHKLKFRIIPVRAGLASLALILFIGAALVHLARTTNILRDSRLAGVGGALRPYNLGRTQMACWFFLILSSYLLIWLITGNLDTITPSLLGLMGISTATALGDVAIDHNKANSQAAQADALNAEKTTLANRLTELESELAAIQSRAAATPPTRTPSDASTQISLNAERHDKQNRLQQIVQTLQRTSLPPDSDKSEGFLKDILSAGAGYSFHRFQIFAWTMALMIVFVSSVYQELKMPEFSATLLGLMGISAGTYIGFKFPEQ